MPRASISRPPGSDSGGGIAPSTSRPPGSRSNSTAMISAPESPSITEWWTFVSIAMAPLSSPEIR